MAAADTLKEINIEVKRCPDCAARFGIDAAFCPFDGSPLTTSTWDKAGDPRSKLRVGDRYDVLEPLGEGGMGTVYKVRHVTLDRMFAMKVLRRDLAADAGLAARFVQEARATAAIKHPSVVAITDFGEMEDGIPYFVMELLEGETLATRIRARGPVIPRTAIRIGKQIAEGLAASHAANVIHRDLKPDNVFLVGRNNESGSRVKVKAGEEEIRIVDFGAAKIIGGSKLTRPGIVFGTPYYMSPEQASGQPIDARADVYSLGILLYEMITGRVPFEADTYMGVLTKHIFHAPARPAAPSGIQLGELENVVMRALQKDPAERYASMTAFAEALDAAATARGSVRPPSPSIAQRTLQMRNVATTADRIQSSVNRRVAAEAQRKRRMIAIAFVAACATFGFGAVVMMLGGGASSSATPPRITTEPVAPTQKPTTPTPSAGITSTATAAIVADPATTAALDPSQPLNANGGSFGLGNPSTAVVGSTTGTPTSFTNVGARPRVLIGPRPRTPLPSPGPSPVALSTSTSTTAATAPAPTPAPAPSPIPPHPGAQGTSNGGGRSTDDFKDPWKH